MSLTQNVCKQASLFAAGLLISGAELGAAETERVDDDDVYTWSAELVEFDDSSRLTTVKSRIEGHADRRNGGAVWRFLAPVAPFVRGVVSATPRASSRTSGIASVR